jgi:hypothetical protein
MFTPFIAGGCASTARDTSGFAVTQEADVNASFDQTWQAVKHALREHELDIFTRDKRGTFVAYSKAKGIPDIKRRRVKHTITIEARGEEKCHLRIDTVSQVYGVTLLTYPGWHDRKMKDPAPTQELLAKLQAKVEAELAQAKATPTSEAAQKS